MCQNCAQLSDDAFKNVAASGISTSRLRYKSVKPSANPKPGNTLRFLNVTVTNRFTFQPAANRPGLSMNPYSLLLL